MPRIRCKACPKVIIVPPNKAERSTGYCRKCYHQRFHNGKRKVLILNLG